MHLIQIGSGEWRKRKLHLDWHECRDWRNGCGQCRLDCVAKWLMWRWQPPNCTYTAVHGPVWVDSYGRLHLLQWASFLPNDSPATVGWDPVTVWFCWKTETAQTPGPGPGWPLYPGGSGPPLRRPAGHLTGRVADENDALHDGSPKKSGMPSWQTTAPIRGLTGTELVG